MTETKLILPNAIADNWHVIKPELVKALDHGANETSATEWLRRLISLEAQLWHFSVDGEFKGLGLTQFIQYPNHKTLHLVACTGDDWSAWAHLYYDVEKFAKRNGCIAVETWGRPGWSKVLPKHIPGFETVYHVLRKNIHEDKDLKTES